MNKTKITNAQVEESAYVLAEILAVEGEDTICIYGIPRGGVSAAYMVYHYLRARFNRQALIVEKPEHATVFIDDLVDSGKTQQSYIEKYGIPFYALFNKEAMDDPTSWLVFPWEVNDAGGADDIPTRLLQYIGEKPERGGLLETPKRFLKAWDHYTSGYGKDPKEILKVFKDGAEKCDEMVLIRNIPVYSHCEHHLAPFFGVAHVGYIPEGSIVGLSKLPRLVDIFARRLQVQERLTNQIADALEEHLKPKGIGVVLECRHMCMESRGIQQQGTSTITSAMRGALRDDEKARAEFMNLIKL